MDYVLYFLEVVSSIFSHDLEAVRSIQPIFVEDLLIHSGSNALSLEWWQDEYLGYLGPERVKCEMCFVYSEECHQLLGFGFID